MMDRDQSARLLFDYLRDILYAESPQAPDMAEFSPAMHDLGLGLQYLQQAVEEMKEYSQEYLVFLEENSYYFWRDLKC